MMISYNCENGTIQCYWLLISRSLDSGLAFPPVAEERIRWQSTTSPQHKTHFQLLPPPAHTNTSKRQKSLRSLFFSQHHNNVLAKGNLCWEYYLFDCFYIRFKQWLNIIRAKWQYKPCKQCKLCSFRVLQSFCGKFKIICRDYGNSRFLDVCPWPAG